MHKKLSVFFYRRKHLVIMEESITTKWKITLSWEKEVLCTANLEII